MRVDRRQFLGAGALGAALLARKRPSAAPAASTSADDPLGVRRDFAVARQGEAYLNTAYIGPVPDPVERAGVEFVRSKARRPIPLGAMLEKTDEVRRSFAAMVGASPEEIGFLFATSEGENVVAHAIDWRAGDNVVVDALHYTTSYVLYRHLEETKGVELRVVPASDGRATPESFAERVDRRTRLVSVAWVSHQNGYRHDVRALAELAHAHGAYLYTDAVQAVGMFPMRLAEDGVDFLTSGTYKWLFAGYGVAPFYVRRELLDRIPPDRRGALHVEEEREGYRYRLYRTAKKFEYATLAFGAVYQLGAAVEYLRSVGLDRIEAHTVALAKKLRSELVRRGFAVRTPEDNGSAIVAFVHRREPDRLREHLAARGIAASLREKGTELRVGIALFNDEADVERLLDALDELPEVESA